MEATIVKRVDSYLGSNAIRAMSNSLSLAATVLRFQIVELWHEDESGDYCCTYVHAIEEVLRQYKDIIVGYYPEHTREHMISPKLCELSKLSTTRCHWRSIESEQTKSCLYRIAGFPVQTEMGYIVEGRSDGPNVFIVGFASEIIDKKQSKMKFLFGLGYAISVAAFEFEDDDFDDDIDNVGDELDIKKFEPARPLVATPFVSTLSFGNLALPHVVHSPNVLDVHMNNIGNNISCSLSAHDAGLGIWGKNLSEANFQNMQSFLYSPRSDGMPAANESDIVGLDLSESPTMSIQSVHSSGHDIIVPTAVTAKLELLRDSPSSSRNSPSLQKMTMKNTEKVVIPTLNLSSMPRPLKPAAQFENPFLLSLENLSLPPLSARPESSLNASGERPPSARPDLPISARSDSRNGQDTSRHSVASTIMTSLPPTWDPAAPFSFPVASIPAKHILPDDLTIESFADVNHIADGSNANIFSAKFHGQRVIIKMIKASVQSDPVSVHEFDVEHGLLCRVSHPNIIKILGAGVSPRRFIVLEYLGGGTLNNILAENFSKSGLASRLFRKPTFTYNNLLMKARDMADALDYIHRRFHPGACIIHRDLKPDNIGFSSDGVVKLFDFGLATCVKSRSMDTERYEMTGMTGSLRYMAPETAMRKPYTEKVDVYSYGILVWQMARDRIPFKGLGKDEFLNNVAIAGERPKLDSSWPAPFSSLLTKCWHQDPAQRPPFSVILEELNRMIHGDIASPVKPRPLRGAMIKSGSENLSTSTWF